MSIKKFSQKTEGHEKIFKYPLSTTLTLLVIVIWVLLLPGGGLFIIFTDLFIAQKEFGPEHLILFFLAIVGTGLFLYCFWSIIKSARDIILRLDGIMGPPLNFFRFKKIFIPWEEIPLVVEEPGFWMGGTTKLNIFSKKGKSISVAGSIKNYPLLKNEIIARANLAMSKLEGYKMYYEKVKTETETDHLVISKGQLKLHE